MLAHDRQGKPWLYEEAKSKPAAYLGPKRRFSIIRTGDEKNRIILVDKKSDAGIRQHDEKLGAKFNPYGDYVVDSVTYGNHHPPKSPPISYDLLVPGGVGNTEYKQDNEDTTWNELEIDTDDFLPAVVPQWAKDKEKPPVPPLQ
jgi:hypothetical protein